MVETLSRNGISTIYNLHQNHGMHQKDYEKMGFPNHVPTAGCRETIHRIDMINPHPPMAMLLVPKMCKSAETMVYGGCLILGGRDSVLCSVKNLSVLSWNVWNEWIPSDKKWSLDRQVPWGSSQVENCWGFFVHRKKGLSKSKICFAGRSPESIQSNTPDSGS